MAVTNTAAHSTAEIARVERDAKIVELKRTGISFEAVAQELGIGTETARRGFHRAIRAVPEPAVASYRADQLARIEMMRESILDVFAAKHILVSQGHVVKVEMTREDGTTLSVPLPDSGPILAAADRLMKLDEVEAKLLGLYPSAKVSLDATVNYTVAGVDLDALK